MAHAVVLGSAAGGGFPQWNSNAPACRRARRGDASSRVLAVIAANPIFDVLAPDCVRRVVLPLDERIKLAGASGACGLAVVAFAVPGKVPLYLETTGQDPGLSEE